MANTLRVIDKITREASRILHNNLAFVKTVDTQYDDQFAQSGAKIGSSIRIRLPARFPVRSGATINTTRDTIEPQNTLTLDSQRGIDVEFSSQEATLDLDDFSQRILRPGMARLASEVDLDGLGQYTNVFNYVGTPGTTPATAKVWLDAGVKLDNQATPRDGQRYACMSPQAQADTVDGLKGLFQSAEMIGEQYRKGEMGTVLGLNFGMDQNVRSHTVGEIDGTPLIDTTSSEGDTTVHIDGLTDATAVAAAGDQFTIASINSVNPETGEDTGQLAVFTVTAATTAVSNEYAALPISPEIRSTGARATVVSLPADGDAITIIGTEASVYPQNIVHHRDAFVLGTADLVMPYGVDMASRQVQDGISLRFIRDYDINEDRFLGRFDVLYGWLTNRPELACRVWG